MKLLLIKLIRKIRDKLVCGIMLMAIVETFTPKSLRNEVELWDTTAQIQETFMDRLASCPHCPL